MTAACATSLCPIAMPSNSMEGIHSPPDLIMSFARSVTWM